jgi:hypothetical protein
MIMTHVPPIFVCLAVDVSIFLMLSVLHQMPVTLLNVHQPKVVFIPISLNNVIREINVTTMTATKSMDAHQHVSTAMTTTTVLTTAANHLMDVNTSHTTVMTTTLVLPKNVKEIVNMNE